MQKRFRHKDFIRSLYAYLGGNNKPKKAKVTNARTSYRNVDESSFDTDFGSGFAQVTGPTSRREFEVSSRLNPSLAGAIDPAGQGLQANAEYLARDPEQRVDYLRSGNDPYYNILQENADRNRRDLIGRAEVNSYLGGRSNSTSMGAALGQIYNDDILRQNQILLSALDYGNQTARNDIATQLGLVSGLNQLVTPLGAAASAQLQTALNARDRVSLANAGAKNAAELQYASDYNRYQASQPSLAGNLIGTGISALGLLPGAGSVAGLFNGGAQGGGGSGGIVQLPLPGGGYANDYNPGGSMYGGPYVPPANPITPLSYGGSFFSPQGISQGAALQGLELGIA